MNYKKFKKIISWAKKQFGLAYAHFKVRDLKMIKEMYHEYNS